jgi:hypothetical protein
MSARAAEVFYCMMRRTTDSHDIDARPIGQPGAVTVGLPSAHVMDRSMGDKARTLYERLGGYDAISAVVNVCCQGSGATRSLAGFGRIKTVSNARNRPSSIFFARPQADRSITAAGT